MIRLRYIASRLVRIFIVFCVVLVLSFIVFRLIPGDPFTVISEDITPKMRQEMLEKFGLLDPWHVQFFRYVVNIFSGEFGYSYRYGVPVLQIIAKRLPNTLILIIPGIFAGAGIGCLMGANMARKHGTATDHAGELSLIAIYSTPIFLSGLFLIYIFSYVLGWLPAGGMAKAGSGTGTFFSLDFLRHYILPFLSVTMYYLAMPGLLTRNNMLLVLGTDYIEMAKAKGLKDRTIWFSHALRNAILPAFTYVGMHIGHAFGGSVILEYTYSWPGLGREMLEAVLRHDYPLAQGSFLMFSGVIMLMNLVTDLLYTRLDPRVSL